MNRKFQRTCELEIGVEPDAKGDSKPLTIPPEFTVEFEVRREMMASAQDATFRIFNLGPVTRDKIFQDLHTLATDGSGKAFRRPIKFRAGYGDFRPLVFHGFINSASSYRRGTDFVTEIVANDCGFGMSYGFTLRTLAGPQDAEEVIRTLGKELPGVAGSPIIGEWPKTVKLKRGVILAGNTWDLLNTYAGGKAFIDNGQLKVLDSEAVGVQPNGQTKTLRQREAIKGTIAVLSSDSGLLGPPRRGANRMEVTMLFEPRFTIGQVVDLESESWKTVNRTYQVVGFTHRGTISPTVAGDCTTEVLLLGPAQFKIIEGKAVMQ